MKYTRIIPKLDIKGPNLVKGIHLEGLRVLGKPENFAKYYYSEGADELIFQDTVASLYQRNNLTEIIKKTAENIFIPLTVGGGIRSLENINSVLRAGADKVSINTSCVQNPNLINEASKTFGSSTIVISVEASKQLNGEYYLFTDNGREYTGKKVLDWVREVQDRGAGEILLTSIDQEGTGNGYDLSLIKEVSDNISIPLIAHGGAGKIEDLIDSVTKSGADALALSSMLHYPSIKKVGENFKYNDEGNIEFLKSFKASKKFKNNSILMIKQKMIDNKLQVRLL
ncbi:imidazole glycerol phosphate synthase cyclase subunit [Candidatus Marinimicrobia bacterium]|nr:imidazole glycerol phosphate synthase cyclase subunit [Candidatus Neomarinimicrobiota bacterium]